MAWFGASAVVMTYCLLWRTGCPVPLGGWTPCDKEAVSRPSLGKGWMSAEKDGDRRGLQASRGSAVSYACLSLFMRCFVEAWERIGWLVKVSSTKTASEREMKENLHNQSQGREVIAKGGAGDDVGKKKLMRRALCMITDGLEKGKREKDSGLPRDCLSCMKCRDKR